MKAFARVFFFILAVGILVGLVSCDYQAYRQRFPNAAPWTYFFQK